MGWARRLGPNSPEGGPARPTDAIGLDDHHIDLVANLWFGAWLDDLHRDVMTFLSVRFVESRLGAYDPVAGDDGPEDRYLIGIPLGRG